MICSKPVVLLILDGWGWRDESQDNAIHAAKTPTWDFLIANYPHMLLKGCGEDVGLPEGQMGNSEVGHLTMGAGRVIYQDLTLINKQIKTGQFFENSVLINAFKKANETQKSVHMMGLLSPGGVHSHEEHLFAALALAKQYHNGSLYVHAFLDGRDTPPQSAQTSLEKLNNVLAQTNALLATVSGRYYAMDRDKRYERIKMAFDAIVHGRSMYRASSGQDALAQAYERQETDEFVKPTCIIHHDNTIKIAPGDIVIYMNFRADRARALSEALTQENYTGFDRQMPTLGEFITLTEYDKNLKAQIIYPPQIHKNVLAQTLQNAHLKQLHLAETEKYAHVTFFFNGGIEIPFQGEKRILIPSPKVATYDLQPQMSAYELTQVLTQNIKQQKFDFIVCNYANADMVGHTGNFPATVKAIEALDECLGQVIQAINTCGGQLLITSDHGNAECMQDQNGQPHTAHTLSLVPLVYYGDQKIQFAREIGALCDIAPTLLYLLGIKQPLEMTGYNLIK